MNTDNGNRRYEVLNPWAEIDPEPIRGISPGLGAIEDKTIGLFHNVKKAGLPILTVVEARLSERYPRLKLKLFKLPVYKDGFESEYEESYNQMLTEVDAVILAVGD